MGLFELKNKLHEAKKDRLIKKLAVEEEKAQKRHILSEKESELNALRQQVKAQKDVGSKSFDFNKIGKASVGVAKGIGKASVGVAKGFGEVLGQMEQNKKDFEEKKKKKQDNIGFF